MLGSKVLCLVNADDREWKINQLLFADDTALVTDLEKNFGRIWTNEVVGRRMIVALNDELLEEVECLKYLRSTNGIDGQCNKSFE